MKRVLSTLAALTSSRWVRIGAGTFLGGVFLYLSLRHVDYREVGATLAQADGRYVGLALVSVAINTLAKAVRWKTLIGVAGAALPFSRLLGLHLVGQMLNKFLPARFGDLTRAYVVGGLMVPGRTFALGTVVLEKLLDMLAYVLLFFLLIILLPLPAWVSDSVYVLSLVTFLSLAGVVLLLLQRDWFLRWLDRAIGWLPVQISAPARDRVQSGLMSLEILRHRADRFKLVGWTVLIWGTALANNYLVLLALPMSLERPLVASLLILVTLQVGISLPTAPGTIGVFQYICVVALGLLGVGPALAFSYGVLLHAVVMLPTTLVGVGFLWAWGMPGKQAAREEPRAMSDRGNE
ncbi:MAG: flippase-like domain-containing protein [Chloroflexaceae bacterium]|nr:flippase-like domain-containing protein [Chloroflexaceae bacterium]